MRQIIEKLLVLVLGELLEVLWVVQCPQCGVQHATCNSGKPTERMLVAKRRFHEARIRKAAQWWLNEKWRNG